MVDGLAISEMDYKTFNEAVRQNAQIPVAFGSARNAKIIAGEIGDYISTAINLALNGVAEAVDLEALERRVSFSEHEIEQIWINLGNIGKSLFNGDPMQLAHGDGSFTHGFADVRHELDGIYSDFSLIADCLGYFITMSEDRLNVGIHAVNKCANCFVAFGTRDDASEAFEATEWRELAEIGYVDKKQDKLTAGANIAIDGSAISAIVNTWVDATSRISWNPSVAMAVNVTQCRRNSAIKTMIISFNFTSASAIAAGTLLGTLESGYQPVYNSRVPYSAHVNGNENGGAYAGILMVDSNGEISSRQAIGGGRVIFAEIVYNVV